MDLQPDAVSHPVPVRPAEPGRLDERARGGVGVASVHAGRDGREAGELRLEAERVAAPAAAPRPRRPRTSACSPSSSRRRCSPRRRRRARPARSARRRAPRAATPRSRRRRRRPRRRRPRRRPRGSSARSTTRARFSLRPREALLRRAPRRPRPRARSRDASIAISSSSLTARSALDEAGARHRVDARVDERAVERVREVLLLELDPPARRAAPRSRG